jgi:peptide/nickel transport system substrate-binding protein
MIKRGYLKPNGTGPNSKRHFPKYFGLLLSFTIIFILLAGCSQSSSLSPSATTTTAATTAVAPKTTPAQSVTAAPPSASQTTAAATTPKNGGTLRVMNDSAPGGPTGYPPEVNSSSNMYFSLCVEPLVRETNTGEIIPWLAESYKIADDYKSITFNLRKGVKFHDGSDFNAQVAKWNIDNAINAKLEPYFASVDAVNDYSIKVNFSQWQNVIINNFAGDTVLYMISKASFDKNGLDWVRQNPVGTGPFKFASYQTGVSWKTVKNPDYWMKGFPYLDGIEMKIVADPMTQQAAMLNKEADMILTIPGKIVHDMNSAGLQVITRPIDTIDIFPDTGNADSPFAKKNVRESVEYALDRESIAKSLLYGYFKAPNQIPGSGLPIYNPNISTVRKFDVAKAKQLLADAGYATGFKTSIIAAPMSLNKDIIVATQGYLSAVGIQADIQYPDPAKWTSDYMTGKWQSSLLVTPVPGSNNYNFSLNRWLGPNSPFFKNWQRTPEFIQAFNASVNSPAANINLQRAVVEQVAKDCSLIPINEGGRAWVIQSYVMNAGCHTWAWGPYFTPYQAWINK